MKDEILLFTLTQATSYVIIDFRIFCANKTLFSMSPTSKTTGAKRPGYPEGETHEILNH